MDIYEETKDSLKGIWEDVALRQNAKIVINDALADATELTAKQIKEFFAELDRQLLPEDDESRKTTNPGL